MATAREELQRELDELLPDYVSADYLRGVEEFLEGIVAAHGRHPLLVAALKKISARIYFLETGEELKGDENGAESW